MVTQNRGLKAPKDMMEVVIYTQNYRVEGRIHYTPGGRLTDFLNFRAEGSFVAVTKAKVFALSEEEPLHTIDFLDINKGHITMIFPKPH